MKEQNRQGIQTEEKVLKENESEEKPVVWKETLSWIVVVVAAMLLAYVMNRFVIVNARVPSGSMETTIMTGDRILGWRLTYNFREPKRGDIVIFKYPDNENENYIKRIIGLPGEKVTIKEGKVYIGDSNEPLEEDYVKEEWSGGDGVYWVPEDSYFMLGDNRNNSKDSREWVNKYVHRDKILGEASFCYWPFSDFGFLE